MKILTNIQETEYLEGLVVDGKMLLECIMGNWMGRCEVAASGSGKRTVVGSCEPSGPVKGGKFLE
jgi:hypothetical protein